MEQAFKKLTTSMICSSIVALIIGLIMFLFPDISIVTCGIMVGIFVILHGILLVILDIEASKYLIPFDCMLAGILSIVLGIILCFNPDIVATVIAIALGLWIILSSISIIKIAISLMKKSTKWILLLVFGILDFLCGVLVICNPFASALSLTLFIGIMIVVHSIINIVDTVILKNEVKEFTNVIKEKAKLLK